MTTMRSALQALLADRFKLQIHREMRQHSVYDLVGAKCGPKLTAAAETNARLPRQVVIGPGELTGTGASIGMLVQALSRQIGAVVIDRTDLPGTYDFNLKWAPESPAAPGADATSADPAGPSVFTAIQEQLGLKLEPAKGPVEVLVIDHVEKPLPN